VCFSIKAAVKNRLGAALLKWWHIGATRATKKCYITYDFTATSTQTFPQIEKKERDYNKNNESETKLIKAN